MSEQLQVRPKYHGLYKQASKKEPGEGEPLQRKITSRGYDRVLGQVDRLAKTAAKSVMRRQTIKQLQDVILRKNAQIRNQEQELKTLKALLNGYQVGHFKRGE